MRKLIIAIMMLCLSTMVWAQEVSSIVPSMWELLNANDRTFQVQNVDKLNSVEQDYCALEYSNGVLFSSTRSGENAAHQDDSNFYFSSLSNGNLSQPIFYKSLINSVLKEGVATLSPDKQELIFSRAEPGTNRVHLYSVENNNGQWQNVSKLDINVDGYLSGHPAYSKDGSGVYFASNRPGGLGGTDLYFSAKTDNGWGEPVNLGATVNTKDNELYPYIDHNSVLYFSSNRDEGFGGLDLYMTIAKSSSNWKAPLNLGKPFNSSKDDFGIYVSKNEVEGFISSDRVGGKGGSDIYYWNLEDCNLVSGQLVDGNNQPLTVEGISIMVNELDENWFQQTSTNAQGIFEICLPCNKDFSIKTSAEGFYQNRLMVSTKDEACGSSEKINVVIQLFELQVNDIANSNPNTNELKPSKPLSKEELKVRDEKNKTMLESISIAQEIEEEDVEMESIVVEEVIEEEPEILEKTVESIDNTAVKVYPVMPSIYHAFDSFKITKEDQQYLDDLVDYLRANPDLELKVNSYTDVRGRDIYNNWLSDQRANEVQNYLMEKGIEESRIIAEGKGEDMESTNFTESRRTEFSIVDADEKLKTSEIISKEIAKIHYGFDAYHLDLTAKQQVESVITQLEENPDWQVEVISHTDSRGSKVYNRSLSEKRAKQVRKFILSKGISEDRVTIMGKGESELLNECSDGVNCARKQHLENRRTEFIFRYQN